MLALKKPVITYLKSTRHSISICWGSEFFTDNGVLSYTVQIDDTTYGWITKYWGLKTETEIEDLGPEEIYDIRVGASQKIKDGDEETWSDEVWSEAFTSATRNDLPWTFYLFQDIEQGYYDEVSSFIKERYSALHVVNKYGETPLVRAIQLKKDKIIELLISGGAEVNQQSGSAFKTPLMVSCYNGYLPAAIILTENGADWSLEDINGMQAIHYAVDNSQLDLVKYAIHCNSNINAQDNQGWSPLIRGLITESNPEVLSELIKSGADVYIKDYYQRSCLEIAKIKGKQNEEVAKLFEHFIREAEEVEKKEKIALGQEMTDIIEENKQEDPKAKYKELLQIILEHERKSELGSTDDENNTHDENEAGLKSEETINKDSFQNAEKAECD